MNRSGLEGQALRWHAGHRWIVDGVDLKLSRGEIVGLLGPNGAGKTVTLSMVAGLLTPTSGRVLIDGIDVTEFPLYKRARLGLGFLPQERSILTHLSAEDNVAAILETRGDSRRVAHRHAMELLEQFGLSHVAKSTANRLSGGEQRRLEIARSLAIEPHYLLFDEPFAGIDPLTIEALHEILVGLRTSGVGIMITDHNVRETLALCDRAYVLFDGSVLRHGTPMELVGDAEVRAHFLGETFATPAELTPIA